MLQSSFFQFILITLEVLHFLDAQDDVLMGIARACLLLASLPVFPHALEHALPCVCPLSVHDLPRACRGRIYEQIFYFHGRLYCSWTLPWGTATVLSNFGYAMTLRFHSSRLAVLLSRCMSCTGFTFWLVLLVFPFALLLACRVWCFGLQLGDVRQRGRQRLRRRHRHLPRRGLAGQHESWLHTLTSEALAKQANRHKWPKLLQQLTLQKSKKTLHATKIKQMG